MILPVAKQWGGRPLSAAEWWRGHTEAPQSPSTMLRMVPLPTGFAGREEQI